MARDAHWPEEGSELDCPIPKRLTVLTRGHLSTQQEAHTILFSQSWLWRSNGLWEREADMGHRGDGLRPRGALVFAHASALLAPAKETPR